MGIKVSDQVYDPSKPAPLINLLYSYPLANAPDLSVLNLQVTFSPGAASPPHRHGGASVSAVVLKGSVYNKMNNEPTKIMSEGESWYEAPGCHHKTSVSASASEEQEAVILATFVVDSEVAEGGIEALVQVDEEYRGSVEA